MKKLTALLLIFFFFVSVANAQQDTTTFYGKSNYMFQHLDKSQISTGLMRDYGIEFLNLGNYNGSFLADSNYVGLQEWRLLYASLYSSQINANSNMVYLDTINNRVLNYIPLNLPITFAVLHYNYQSMREDALISNLITVSNDQMFDVPGRSQSPYQNNQIFAVAPLRQAAVLGSNSIIFRPEMFFSNTGKTLSSIAIDIGETGSYQGVTFNSPFNVNFTQAGFVKISIRITYSDSTVSYAHTKVLVYPYPDDNQEQLRTLGTQKVKNQTYRFGGGRTSTNTTINATKAYQGENATGDITVQLALNNTTGNIRKPLIVVEGFDMDNSFGFSSFVRSISLDGNTNPIQAITLNQGLDDINEYDLIFVNFGDATDYIQRNAFLLERVIEYVNTEKINYNGVRQENVIIGLSMGGLVTRYALRDMELNSVLHETRLFISHDTPHHGANVPVGAQAAVQHLASFQIISGSSNSPYIKWVDMFPDLADAEDDFNSPAAKQMLIQRYNLNPSNYTLTADNATHNTFYTELSNMGWPVNSKNLTLSNGACDGSLVFPSNSRIFELIGDTSMTYFGQLWKSAAMSIAAPITPIVVYGGNVNIRNLLIQFPLSIFSTRSSLNLDFRINSVQQGISELYRGDMYIKRKLLWLINSNSYIIKTRVNSVAGMLPLDNAPGGLYDMNEFGLDATVITNSLPEFFSGIPARVLQPRFCFVPTVSSLAIANPWQNLTSSLCNTINCNTNSGIKNYYSPAENQLHISYTQLNSNWLLQWQNPTFDCPKICQTNFNISGPFQAGSNTTFSMSALPSGATVNWEVTSPYTINGSSTANPVGVAIPSNNNQFAQLVGTINTSCSQTPVIKQLVPASITASLVGNGICGEGVAEINVPNGANFIWRVDGDLSINGQGQTLSTTSNSIGLTGLSGLITCEFKSYNNTVVAQFVYQPYQKPISIAVNPMYGSEPLSATITGIDFGYNSIRWYLDESITNETSESYYDGNLSCGMHTLRAEIDLACGSTVSLGPVEVERYCSFLRNMVIYPNPAVGSNLFIAPDQGKMEKASPVEKSKIKEYDYWLYDARSNVILKGRSKNFKVELDTRNLKSDTYFLHLRTEGDKEIIKKQVIIRN